MGNSFQVRSVMERRALFSTAYMPNVAYMAALAAYEVADIEACETYPKQTYRNRCTIVTANGLLDLTVPVVRPQGNHTATGDTGISYSEPWNVRHWRAIESAYSASPYFLYYRDGIEQILLSRHDRLIDLNQALLTHLLKKMKIAALTALTTDFEIPTGRHGDYRGTFTPKRPLSGIGFKPYPQVFQHKMPFYANMSVIDLLFNMGPEAKQYLQSLVIAV